MKKGIKKDEFVDSIDGSRSEMERASGGGGSVIKLRLSTDGGGSNALGTGTVGKKKTERDGNERKNGFIS